MALPANTGKVFSDLDDEMIRAMHAAKASHAEIAAKLERTEQGVRARLERLGLRKGKTIARQAALLHGATSI